jgi:beta-galactosidase/beta-glucuronidase
VFEGVDSAFYCWINGKRVGYSQDSRLPTEFDVTEHLIPGGRAGTFHHVILQSTHGSMDDTQYGACNQHDTRE